MTENIAPELAKLTIPIDDVHPFDGNARRGDLEAIRESLTVHGQYKPIVAWPATSEILVGNHTWQAAKDLGWQRIAAVWRNVESREQARAIVLVDNRTSDLATYDAPALAGLLDGLPTLDGTGFDQAAVDRILAEGNPLEQTGDLQDPDVPPTPRKPVTRPGDLIELGDHRLYCGDSTSRPDVEALCAGQTADLVFTSPPYNVGVKYRGQAKDDKLASWEAYGGFLKRALEAWLPSVARGRAVCWNIGTSVDTYPARQQLMLEELGLDYVRQVVWDKGLAPMPLWYMFERAPVARNWPCEYRHELVLVFSTGKLIRGDKLDQTDEAARRTVIQITPTIGTRDLPNGGGHSSGSANKGLKRAYDKAHPAVFPAKLPRPFVLHLAAPGELVADPFAGAGTTALACEQLDRRALLMEFDPAFCDVTVERWETLTGRKAKRPRRQRKRAARRYEATGDENTRHDA